MSLVRFPPLPAPAQVVAYSARNYGAPGDEPGWEECAVTFEEETPDGPILVLWARWSTDTPTEHGVWHELDSAFDTTVQARNALVREWTERVHAGDYDHV